MTDGIDKINRLTNCIRFFSDILCCILWKHIEIDQYSCQGWCNVLKSDGSMQKLGGDGLNT